jgi:hypothetical protein
MSDQSEDSFKFISNENSPTMPNKQPTASKAVNKGNFNKIQHSRGITKQYKPRSHIKYGVNSSENVAPKRYIKKNQRHQLKKTYANMIIMKLMK